MRALATLRSTPLLPLRLCVAWCERSGVRRIVQGNALMGAAVCHDMIRGTACVGIYDGNGDEDECEWWNVYSRLYFLPRYIHRLQGLCIARPIHVFEYVSSLDKFLCSGSVLVPTYELLSRQVCGHAHVCSAWFWLQLRRWCHPSSVLYILLCAFPVCGGSVG